MLFRAFALTYNINEYLKQQNMFFQSENGMCLWKFGINSYHHWPDGFDQV